MGFESSLRIDLLDGDALRRDLTALAHANSDTAKLRKLAQRNDDAEYTNLWAGQAAASEGIRGTREVFLELAARYGEGR